MKCNICQSDSQYAFSSLVLNKYTVKYYRCPTCGFMQCENPHWLKEAYDRPINDSDTGYVSRNISLSKIVLGFCVKIFGKDKIYLDYASGYGIFPRIMRDYGLDFYWSDPYVENLFCKYFEYTSQNVEALTCFECFEHLDKPVLEIEKMLSISKNVIFSTLLLPDDKTPTTDWWYYGFNHGQHVAFYSKKTLEFIAQKYKLNLYTDGIKFHILTTKKVHPLKFRLLLRIGRSRFAEIFARSLQSKTSKDSAYVIQKKK